MSRPLPEDLDRILHDLRGPLNAVVMHLEVVKRLASDLPAAKSSLETIQSEIERVTQMLTAAFDVVALEPSERGPVSLRAILDEIATEPGLEQVTIGAAAAPEIRGERRLLRTALAHLVRDAVDATRKAQAARPPEVSLDTTDASVTVVVRDWGVSFSSTNPRSVVRLPGAGGAGQRGANLMAVYRIARLHGGRLSVGSPGEPAEGAEVRLTLPREV